jgi:hypothetical protein
VPRAARPVAALTVPQADEIDLVGSEAERRIEHPAVVALVSVLPRPDCAEIAWGDMKDGGRLDGKISGAPIAVGEIDRLFEKDRLVKRNVELETRAAVERRLGEQEIAAAGATADRKIRETDPEVNQRFRDRARGDRLLVGRKARRLAAGGVDHMTAEQDDFSGPVRIRFRHLSLSFRWLGASEDRTPTENDQV